MENQKTVSIGELIKTARHLQGMSMAELCLRLNNSVTRQTISNYERGRYEPTEVFLTQLKAALNLPDNYFSEQQATLTDIELRYKGSLPVKKYDQLKTIILSELSNYVHLETKLGLKNTFSNPVAHLPISGFDDIETAASLLRKSWELGSQTIPMLCIQLEYRGIRIIDIAFDDQSFDGMSGTINSLGQPFIVVNRNFTVERRRFTVAHELGHLILNIGGGAGDKERLCNRFAGALLFPRTTMAYELGSHRRSVTLEELVTLKESYGMSIAAIVHRAFDLGIIDRKYYDHIFDSWINRNKLETGWGDYQITDVPRRYAQLKARAVSEGVVPNENVDIEITTL
jgi:Zn-dependent peptidase ImmA (M78 family)/transcriptional regulator with XRE-family HTH domain